MPKSKRAPYLAVHTDVVKDECFAVLGDVAGYNRHEALGRMIALWSFCRDRGLEDAPEDCRGYAVHERVVRRFLGERGVDAILGDGCEAFALGERFRDGLIYLRGTSDDVARLRELKRTAEAGGKARAAGQRDGAGRFSGEDSVRETTNVQPSSTREPAIVQPSVQPEPPQIQIQIQNIGSPSGKNDSPGASRPSKGKAAQVIAHWNTRFERAHGTRPLWSAATQRLVDRLVGQFDPDEIKRRIDTAFDAPPKWPEGPYDFDTFARHFDKFIRAQPRAGPAIRVITSREERARIAREQHEHDEESA